MPTSSSATATTIATLTCALVRCCVACLLCLPFTVGFHPCSKCPPPPLKTFQPASTSSTSTTSSTALSFQWPALPSLFAKRVDPTPVGERNGLCPEFPWRFEGRFVFRPSLVRIAADVRPPSATLLSAFGYSLGGSVVLEYDVSPVGPYREYVTMGGVVGGGQVDVGSVHDDDDEGVAGERTLGVGQWGTALYVSTPAAEDVCRRAWGVPAQVADIRFVADGDGRGLADGPDGEGGARRRTFTLSGWDEHARILDGAEKDVTRYGNVPIYWTPTIKALWAPWLLPGRGGGAAPRTARPPLLPLHKLRLSASAVRLKGCRRIASHASARGGEIPLGLALVVDNVLIEIGERVVCE